MDGNGIDLRFESGVWLGAVRTVSVSLKWSSADRNPHQMRTNSMRYGAFNPRSMTTYASFGANSASAFSGVQFASPSTVRTGLASSSVTGSPESRAD